MLRRVALERTDVPSPKHWFLQEPHGVTSQKTAFFIVIAVKTTNLTAISISSEETVALVIFMYINNCAVKFSVKFSVLLTPDVTHFKLKWK
jgi:hypothetical protein